MNGWTWLVGGIATGTIMTAITLPLPTTRSDCAVDRVTTKVATAYVLKPPAGPPAEHITIVKEKCEAPAVEPEKVEEERPRRKWRHMKRHRRHW